MTKNVNPHLNQVCPHCHRSFLPHLFDDHVKVCERLEHERRLSRLRFSTDDLSNAPRASAYTCQPDTFRRKSSQIPRRHTPTYAKHVFQPAYKLFLENEKPVERDIPFASGLSAQGNQESRQQQLNREFKEFLKHPLFDRDERKLGKAILAGKTHQEIAKLFKVNRSTITRRIDKLHAKIARIIESENARIGHKKYIKATFLLQFKPRK